MSLNSGFEPALDVLDNSGLPTKTRLTLIITSLGAGGAERVLTSLANDWVGRNHVVDILTLAAPDHQSHYALDNRITVNNLNLTRDSSSTVKAVMANIRRVRALRKAISATKPDVVISFIDQTNVLSLLACMGLKIPVVVSERIHPAYHPIGRFWTILRSITYPMAARIVVQTESAAQYFSKKLRNQITIIANPVNQASTAKQSVEANPKTHVLLAMGRLHRQKGFDLLLEAFSKIHVDLPEWHLCIYGEGEERTQLEQLTQRLEIKNKVSLPGITSQPELEFDRADCFILSSRYEGFPNVLLEAMSHGLPVIAFACPGGPSEIITHGNNGLLAEPENTEALSAQIKELLTNPELQKKLGTAARSVAEDYSLKHISNQWLNLIQQVKTEVNK